MARQRSYSFSLIEVVIATGIFALAITVILALLPATVRELADSRDAANASRLGDAIRLETQHLATQNGFDALAASIPVADSSFDTGLLLVASRGSADVRPAALVEPVLRDQYFLIELRRFPSGQLGYDSSAAGLALSARISWPYRALTPTGLSAPTDAANRQQVFLTVVIQR
jgi:type II secretory pathway pseudopilin PulG